MYPNDDEIKGQWKTYHKLSIFIATIIIWPLFFIIKGLSIFNNVGPFLSVLGLYIDIIGVVMASVEAPYFGLFADGGDIERKRTIAKEKYFKIGLMLIGIGFLLQGIAIIIQ